MPVQTTLRDCCVNTDDGLSFRSGDGSCTNCIGERNLSMQLIIIARFFCGYFILGIIYPSSLMYALSISTTVHGFSSAEYRLNESVLAFVDEFKMFVKGGSLGVRSTPGGLPGSLDSVDITARGEL